jgi:anthranilate phosphoribosyltransferase
MNDYDDLKVLVRELIEINKSISPEIIKRAFQNLIAISNAENPLPVDSARCNTSLSDQSDALFYVLSAILSRDLFNYETLKAATAGMMLSNDHSQKIKKNSLCVAATGGENKIRTLYVTIPVGIICSLYLPTVVQGNRAVTGCGCGGFAESDMMEFFQYPLFLPREKGEDMLSATNFFYAHAQAYHPILRRFARERGVIGFKDIYKIATGLSDPFRCEYQYLCVWDQKLAEISARVFSGLDHTTKAIVTSGDMFGVDELPITGGPFFVAEKQKVVRKEIRTGVKVEDISNLGEEETISEEALSIEKILNPKNTDRKILDKRNLVKVNTALALSTAMDKSFDELMRMIENDINSEKALKKFEEIKKNALVIR